MRILLVEPDYYAKFPSLALLKIATHHKQHGDTVKYVKGNILLAGKFDRIYVTSLYTWAWKNVARATKYYKALFPHAEMWLGGIYPTFHKEHAQSHTRADYIVEGLIDHQIRDLPPIDELFPDYEILKEVEIWRNWDASLVYSSRGCKKKCSFCVVPYMEGNLKARDSIKSDIRPDYRWVILWDNDFFSSPHRDKILRELRESGKWIDFNQGLNASQIDLATAKELATLDIRAFASGNTSVRTAYDFSEQGEDVKGAIGNLKSVGFKDILVYNLYNYKETPDEFFERVRNTLKWGAKSYPMRYQPVKGSYALDWNKYIDESYGWTKKKLDWIEKCRGLFGKGGIMPPYKELVKRMNLAKNFDEMFEPYSNSYKAYKIERNSSS